jgi:hypothetical protein
MTKALRITSIAVAAAAVLLIALPPVFSSGIDEQAQNLLNSPGVLESLKKTTALADSGTVSPLVQQARDFAKYLNPPPPPKKPAPARSKRTSVRPRAQVSAKFELLGTSYYALRPEMSLALIDEPGKGLRWIRQSSKIGHLVVEEVKDGKIVIRDGTRTYELEAKRTPRRNLVKGEPAYSAEAPPLGVLQTAEPPSYTVPESSQDSSTRGDNRRNGIVGSPSRPPKDVQGRRDLDAAEVAIFDQFVKEIEDIEDPNEWLEKANKIMEQLEEASRVTEQEASLLDELGEELQDANEDSSDRSVETEPETATD